MTRLSAVALSLIVATAHADGVATWLWDVTTDNGDAIVEPGETATITLSMLMEPDDHNDYAAFGVAIFDILGDYTVDDGVILGWEYPNNLGDLVGDTATSDGVSIFNIGVGQLPGFGPFTNDNPVEVFIFEWQPAAGPQTITFETATMIEDQDGMPIQGMFVWEGEDQDAFTAVHYPVVEGAITITVVPAPAGVLLVGAGAVSISRRLRTPSVRKGTPLPGHLQVDLP